MATFGENLKRVRKEKKLTLKELSNIMNISVSFIMNMTTENLSLKQ